MITEEEKQWIRKLLAYKRVPVRLIDGNDPPRAAFSRVHGERRFRFIAVGEGWLILQRQAKIRATVRHLFTREMPDYALADWLWEQGGEEEASTMRELL